MPLPLRARVKRAQRLGCWTVIVSVLSFRRSTGFKLPSSFDAVHQKALWKLASCYWVLQPDITTCHPLPPFKALFPSPTLLVGAPHCAPLARAVLLLDLKMAEAVPEFHNLEEVASLAEARMTKMAFDYYASGAETQQTVSDNRTAFDDYRIVPRILVDVSKVDTGCHLFGTLLLLLPGVIQCFEMLPAVSGRHTVVQTALQPLGCHVQAITCQCQ